MGSLTLDEMRDELLIALRSRDDLSDAQLTRWINQGYIWVCTPEIRKHEELRATYTVTLVTGQNVYPLDSTTVGYHILGISEVTAYDGTATNTEERHDVRPRDIEWFNRTRVPSGGSPRHYLWRGTDLTFSPVPSSAESGYEVELSVWREPARLSADTDVTVLTDYWDEAVILGAQWIAEYRLGTRELSFATQQMAVKYINEKAAGNELQSEDTHFQAEVRSESYQ